MYGLTNAEIDQVISESERVDRADDDPCTPLESRLFINMARAGNVQAIRTLERVFIKAGMRRSEARANLAQLREMGPVPEPEAPEMQTTLNDFENFLKGLDLK